MPRVNGVSFVTAPVNPKLRQLRGITEDNFWHHCGGGVWERNMLVPVERSGGAVRDRRPQRGRGGRQHAEGGAQRRADGLAGGERAVVHAHQER